MGKLRRRVTFYIKKRVKTKKMMGRDEAVQRSTQQLIHDGGKNINIADFPMVPRHLFLLFDNDCFWQKQMRMQVED